MVKLLDRAQASGAGGDRPAPARPVPLEGGPRSALGRGPAALARVRRRGGERGGLSVEYLALAAALVALAGGLVAAAPRVSSAVGCELGQIIGSVGGGQSGDGSCGGPSGAGAGEALGGLAAGGELSCAVGSQFLEAIDNLAFTRDGAGGRAARSQGRPGAPILASASLASSLARVVLASHRPPPDSREEDLQRYFESDPNWSYEGGYVDEDGTRYLRFRPRNRARVNVAPAAAERQRFPRIESVNPIVTIAISPKLDLVVGVNMTSTGPQFALGVVFKPSAAGAGGSPLSGDALQRSVNGALQRLTGAGFTTPGAEIDPRGLGHVYSNRDGEWEPVGGSCGHG